MQLKHLIFLIFCILFETPKAQPWQVEDLHLIHDQQKTQLKIKQLNWAGEVFKNITYQCPEQLPIYPVHQCNNAQLAASWQGLNWQLQMDSSFDFASRDMQLTAALFNDQATFKLNGLDMPIEIELADLSLNTLSNWLPKALLQSLSATLSGHLILNSETGTLAGKELVWQLPEGGVGDDLLFSQLLGTMSINASHNTLHVHSNWEVTQGEALLGPLYINLKDFSLSIKTGLSLDGTDGWLLNVQIKQASNLEMELLVKLNESFEIDQALMSANILNASAVNHHMLSSALDLYGFKGSEMDGRFQLDLQYNGKFITQGKIRFNDFYFENNKAKLLAGGLSGDIIWHHKQPHTSTLHWQSLLLAGMPVGESSVKFQFHSDEFNILEQPEWPVFDGSIAINEWHISQLFSEYVNMEISAEIMPISLALVTEKMGWPLMTGTISGEIPEVVKKGPVIALQGGLNLNVFEGSMKVTKLSTERLFGVAPVISADVSFTQLNLGQLTEAFDFGRITGLLSGNVDDLRITNWKTDRLKAEIFTVEQKGVKQTISQQAIDHISSLGGIQGALSRTFLRFFDEFKYKQIKLSCVLHNTVCKIGGLKNSPQQFTIVEGGGIPKINIVGFVREVDWDTFISRLLNANYDG